MQTYRVVINPQVANTTEYLAHHQAVLDIYTQDQDTGERQFAFNITPDVLASVMIPEGQERVLLGEHRDIAHDVMVALVRYDNGDIMLMTQGDDTAPVVEWYGSQGIRQAAILPIRSDDSSPSV